MAAAPRYALNGGALENDAWLLQPVAALLQRFQQRPLLPKPLCMTLQSAAHHLGPTVILPNRVVIHLGDSLFGRYLFDLLLKHTPESQHLLGLGLQPSLEQLLLSILLLLQKLQCRARGRSRDGGGSLRRNGGLRRGHSRRHHLVRGRLLSRWSRRRFAREGCRQLGCRRGSFGSRCLWNGLRG